MNNLIVYILIGFLMGLRFAYLGWVDYNEYVARGSAANKRETSKLKYFYMDGWSTILANTFFWPFYLFLILISEALS